MSLDVYLTVSGYADNADIRPRIYIRENGETREISREEWDAKYPGREPFTVQPSIREDHEVFQRNITHNLNRMADEAGIYDACWRPDEAGITTAAQLIEPLEKGLALLRSDPARFKAFNPSNGWGNYDGLVEFVEAYLTACKEYPNARVYASR